MGSQPHAVTDVFASKFTCSFCDRNFKNKSGLSTHVASCKNKTSPASVEKGIRISDLIPLLNSISGDRNEWPRNLRKVTSKNSSRRLPRGSWVTILGYYNEKFSENISLSELQHLASHHRASDAYTAKARAFKSNFATSYSVSSEKRFLESSAIFNEIYNHLSSIQILDFRGSKKFQTKLVGRQTWSELDQIVAKKLSSISEPSLDDVARMIQSAQLTVEKILTNKAQESKVNKQNSSLAEKDAKLESICQQLEKFDISTSESVPSSAFDSDDIDPETREALQFLAERNVNPRDKQSRTRALAECRELLTANRRKLTNLERRRNYWLTNYRFETNPAAFYRNLDSKRSPSVSTEVVEEAKIFWGNMWSHEPFTPPGPNPAENIVVDLPQDAPVNRPESFAFPSWDEFSLALRSLDNWKSSGPDGIYNIFIKRLPSLHKIIYSLFLKLAKGEISPDKWVFTGITHLIPKSDAPTEGKDFRPITCLSNLYKLFTKMLTPVLQLTVEKFNLLSPNQLGAIKATQGAKELAMTNFAINRFASNNLKMAWLDAQKAFDSILHSRIEESLSSPEIPNWIRKFVSLASKSWTLNLRLNGEYIIKGKNVSRGIVQGDSLSPILFCLCLDRMSRRLDSVCPKVNINFAEDKNFCLNHLVFMDDVKLFASSEDDLKKLLSIASEELKAVGLSLNPKKSATNCPVSDFIPALSDPGNTYKYLGFDETPRGSVSSTSASSIKNEALRRLNLLCNSDLNAVNMFTATNEWVISLVDYIVGVIDLPRKWFADFDLDIRRVLTKYNIHNTPACLERLYLKRTELGRGLSNIEFRAERSLFNLWRYIDTFTDSEARNQRRALIRENEYMCSSRLAGINSELESKYGTVSDKTSILNQQKIRLRDKIMTKSFHSQLFKSLCKDYVSVKASSTWLNKGNISAREEGALSLLQDRNLFWLNGEKCLACNEERRTVDHVATRCRRLVPHEYTRRHNEIVSCLSLKLAKSMGLSNFKRVRDFKIGAVTESATAKLWVDTHIKTSVHVKHDKPDIFALDKTTREGVIVDVRISSSECLELAQNEKIQKYDVLANELQGMYNLVGIKILPIIISWDGVMTKRTYDNCVYLGLAPSEIAYVQTRVLKRTLESLSLQERRSIDNPINGLDSKLAIDNLFSSLLAHDSSGTQSSTIAVENDPGIIEPDC